MVFADPYNCGSSHLPPSSLPVLQPHQPPFHFLKCSQSLFHFRAFTLCIPLWKHRSQTFLQGGWAEPGDFNPCQRCSWVPRPQFPHLQHELVDLEALIGIYDLKCQPKVAAVELVEMENGKRGEGMEETVLGERAQNEKPRKLRATTFRVFKTLNAFFIGRTT